MTNFTVFTGHLFSKGYLSYWMLLCTVLLPWNNPEEDKHMSRKVFFSVSPRYSYKREFEREIYISVSRERDTSDYRKIDTSEKKKRDTSGQRKGVKKREEIKKRKEN